MKYIFNWPVWTAQLDPSPEFMTNVDNLLQLALIFFTSAPQLNRKPFENTTKSDSA